MARTRRPGAVPSSPDRGGQDGGAAPELSTEVVHDRLRRAILRGEFDPKVPLSQVKLAARLGVSRTPLREALRMLQREGLIDSEPNRRVRVAELSLADLAELKGALSEMTELAGRDIDQWEAAHQRYHALLRKYAGQRISLLARNLSDHTGRYRRFYMAEPRAWSAAAQEHAAIVDACLSGSITAASTQLARHLARTALTLIALFDPEHEPTPVREALRLVTGTAPSP